MKGMVSLKIKIERSKKETQKRPKKIKSRKKRVIKIGIHRKLALILWILLIFSIIFGVYKNFTAIDRHTVHEKKIIEEKIVDTSQIESFVESFAKEYYTWQHSQKELDSRSEHLKDYLTEDLQQLNKEMVRNDIPLASAVTDVHIWKISSGNNSNTFDVLFSVDQQLTENKKTTKVESTYTLSVHIDKDGNMVIIKNPTISNKPQKSNFIPKVVESDGSVDLEMTKEINEFLESFFKLYPTATKKELAYYVKNDGLPVINKGYVFAELVNPVYTKTTRGVQAIVTIKYLDKKTKTIQFSQFNLHLIKHNNWQIEV